jgi:hypothetical protein
MLRVINLRNALCVKDGSVSALFSFGECPGRVITSQQSINSCKFHPLEQPEILKGYSEVYFDQHASTYKR